MPNRADDGRLQPAGSAARALPVAKQTSLAHLFKCILADTDKPRSP